MRLGRGAGGLLDEVEVLEAERWRASANATDLGYGQALPELVAASHEARRRAMNTRLAAGIAIGTLIVAILAIVTGGSLYFAQQQQQNANKERELRSTAEVARDQAKLQARISLARQIAAQSVAISEYQFDTALLLSLEANHLIESTAVADTLEVRSSLRDVLETSPYLVGFLRSPTNAAVEGGAGFSLDGRTLVSASEDGYIQLWDITTRRLRVPPVKGHINQGMLAAMSPDRQWLAIGGLSDDTITLWDLTAPTPTQHSPPNQYDAAWPYQHNLQRR